MPAPDPKKDLSAQLGAKQASANPLDRYTAQPRQSGGADQKQDSSPWYHSHAPSISLPKGGGALKGIDEKFTVNPVNGTASLSIPLPLTQGRGGFTPSLSLQYNSGSGNSEFGLGWSLGLPSIQRKTDKQLPTYDDNKDVFLMAGAEDLQPVLKINAGTGLWEQDVNVDTATGYTIRRYLPRIEGLWARIEHISKAGEVGSWWKVTTKDNIVTWYGLTAAARIARPGTPGDIFKWLPQYSLDNKGNFHIYSYASEDTANVPAAVHEHARRSGTEPFVNKYLKSVGYCNRTHYTVSDDYRWDIRPVLPVLTGFFLVELVLDYGEHDPAAPTPTSSVSWPCRKDPFSDFHAGFDIRTWRQCRRALLFHYFDELDGGNPVLVRSLDFEYQNDASTDRFTDADLLTAVYQRGYKQTSPASYIFRQSPTSIFTYQQVQWDNTIHDVIGADVENAPQGLSGNYHWIDLWGEGVSGILTEQAGGWFYKENLGYGHFTSAVPIVEKPSIGGLGSTTQWQDLEADGRRQLVVRSGAIQGFFALDDDQEWSGFTPFANPLNVDWESPYTKLLDLDGDGRADVLLTGDHIWQWYHNDGTKGYKEGGYGNPSVDEDKGPRLIVNDKMQAIFLADINGDGLTDLVRISNGEVCYWPNKGWGKFGARVTMTGSPVFTFQDEFNPQFITLADINGTGAPDLLYVSGSTCRVWLNLAGNAWAAPREVILPPMDQQCKVMAADFLGNGTSCIVWSSPLPGAAPLPMKYINLMGTRKPYLMIGYENGLGKRTSISYRHSTEYYLADKRQGIHWITRLPFPVHCVGAYSVRDTVSETSYTCSYIYRHGYYDHEEREFRGFGRVDMYDSERATAYTGSTLYPLDQDTVLTRTWYHTGAYPGGVALDVAYQAEYTHLGITDIPEGVTIPYGLTPPEQREAYRAFKGQPLRQEIVSINSSSGAQTLLSVTATSWQASLVQPQIDNKYASFHSFRAEAVSIYCDGDIHAPRILHELTLKTDEYGNPLLDARVSYPRTGTGTVPAEVADAQGQMLMVMTDHRFTADVITPAIYRLRQPCQQIQWQVTAGFTIGGYAPSGHFWTIDELIWLSDERNAISFATPPIEPFIQFRLLSASRTLYCDDMTAGPLDLGVQSAHGIPYQQYALAFTGDLLSTYTAGAFTDAMLHEAGYLAETDVPQFVGTGVYWPLVDYYWLPGGTTSYDLAHFFTPVSFTDPWGNTTTVNYWGTYYMLPDVVTDALGNTTTALAYSWYLLQPERIKDLNDNESHMVYDALGIPIAAAMMEKDGTITGDTLSGIDPASSTDLFFTDPLTHAPGLLQGASWRCVYKFSDGTNPGCIAMIAREKHNSEDPGSPLLIRLSYTDGLGRVAMHKVQAAPAEGDTTIRWIASGKTIYNNKGSVVMQYEPYYAVSHVYEGALPVAMYGVTPRMHYDPLGRLTRTDLPDGTYTKTLWTPWLQETWDNNDTVMDSAWRIAALAGSGEDIDAAHKAEEHAGTPTIAHLDTLGRPFYTVQHNRILNLSDMPHLIDELPYYESYVVLDILGNRLEVHDARGLTATTCIYNMLQAPVKQVCMDNGTQLMLVNAAEQPTYGWDADDNMFHYVYDELQRKLTKDVTHSGGGVKLLEVCIYGESMGGAPVNLNGKLFSISDGCGYKKTGVYDFKGNPLISDFTLVNDYTQHPDWGSSPAFSSFSATGSYTYDALSRPVSTTNPDSSLTNYSYNETGLLYRVDVQGVAGSLTTDIVNELYYNARGQRTKVKYENGATTVYTYDPYTFRVTRIRTTRSSDSHVLQDLRYWYDPVGNITWQADDALDVIFYGGTMAEPTNKYTYDALYRLIMCEGREHASVTGAVSWNDGMRMANVPLPADATAMRRYTQYYFYDQVGNMLKMKHATTGSDSWVRTFNMDTHSNHVLSTDVGSDGIGGETYLYDARGNIIAGFNHLTDLDYNEENRLRQIVDAPGNFTYYQYDSSGQRVRKVTEMYGYQRHEWMYIGNYEVYRKIDVASAAILLERQTLKVMDDSACVAIIDTPTIDILGTGEVQTLRYQFSNHLGTASLELDEYADIISYEEYYPYGNTSYQAGRSLSEVSLKRYRYVGKERDNESGFYYIGARYYCPWIARWCAVDPINSESYNLDRGYGFGKNTGRHHLELSASPYEYCCDNPIDGTDPTGEQKVDEVVKGTTSTPRPKSVVDPSVAKELTRDLSKGGEQASKEAAREFVVQAEKQAVRKAEETGVKAGLKTLGKIASKANIFLDILQLVAGAETAHAPTMESYRQQAREAKAYFAKIQTELNAAAERIATGVSTPEKEQEKNKNLIFRSMQTINGNWIQSPLIGAGNARQLGARTPQSSNSVDIAPYAGMVGPHYGSGGGLSANTSFLAMQTKLMSDEYTRKEGAIGMFDKRLLIPLGLEGKQDSKDGHVTIHPGSDMKIEGYISILNSIPWIPVFRKSK